MVRRRKQTRSKSKKCKSLKKVGSNSKDLRGWNKK
jgi:hypothetical protein